MTATLTAGAVVTGTHLGEAFAGTVELVKDEAGQPFARVIIGPRKHWYGPVADLTIVPADADSDEPTAEQSAALDRYVKAREERDGLRDDFYYGNLQEHNIAGPQLIGAEKELARAIKEATRLGVIEEGRKLFR